MRILRVASVTSLLLYLFVSVSAVAPLPHQQIGWAKKAQGQETEYAPQQLFPPINEVMCPGETYPFELNLYLPRTPAKGDIIFAFDTTGSMGGVIQSAQHNAIRIMDDLSRLISDVRFGVIDIEDYPVDPYGFEGDEAFQLRQPLTGDREAVRAAIDALRADGGGDPPEAYTRALYEAYTNPAIGWRENARRLLLTFGDSYPHDDDLNAGISPPPYRNKGMRWETGHPPTFWDPGRDGIPGTADDLDFQTTLAALAEQNITLLSVVAPEYYPTPTQQQMVIYWNVWASQTGGKAVPLWNVGELPDLIRQIVEDTIVGVIKRLTLEVEPDIYAGWVYSDPAEITDIPIPSDGQVSFLGRVEVPANTPAGTYQFRVVIVGDGISYGEMPVTIQVPAQCSPERIEPIWYYLPLIGNQHATVPPPLPTPVDPYPGPESRAIPPT